MKRFFRFALIVSMACLLMWLPKFAGARDAKRISPTILKAPASATVVRPATGVTKSAKADLVVSIINFSPGLPTEGAEITLYVFVKNIGMVRAEAFGTRVKVGGEQFPPILQVPGLNPGQEWKHIQKITFDRAGNYIVTVTADVTNVIVEKLETNNIKQATITVRPAPRPDLIVSKINYSPGSPKKNDDVNIWYFVKNIGPGKSPISHLSVSLSVYDPPVWFPKTVPALGPGREYRADGYIKPSSAGTFFIKAFIDRNDNIAETNELNNELQRQIVVTNP